MGTLIDPALLEHATGGRILAGDEVATVLLDAAARRVIDHLGWEPWPRRETTTVIDSIGTDAVTLPSRLVHDVSSVEIDGRPLAPAAYRWSQSGMVELVRGVFPTGFRRVSVTYEHGSDTPPGAVADIIVALAARGSGSASLGLIRMRAGSVEEQRSAELAIGGLLGPDREALGRWRVDGGGFGV